MGFQFHKIILSIGVMLALSLQLWAAESDPSTSATPNATNTATQDALLQIQEQLRATQLSLADGLQQSQAMTARIQALEQTMAAQHAADVDLARRSQQWTLTLICIFGVAALAIMSLMVYFQWQAFLHVAEMSTRQTAALPLGDPRLVSAASAVSQLAAPGRAQVESSNSRLLGAVERLERRIRELEHETHVPLAEKNQPAEKPAGQPNPAIPAAVAAQPQVAAAPKNGHANGTNGTPGKSQDTLDREECIANLFSEGQALLNAGEAEKALECFEGALRLFPRHPEALVKKGTALEKLGRLDEAIVCYDQAIESDNALTVAYLQKGGLFNRLARYDEALKCYERALQTQEKKTA